GDRGLRRSGPRQDRRGRGAERAPARKRAAGGGDQNRRGRPDPRGRGLRAAGPRREPGARGAGQSPGGAGGRLAPHRQPPAQQGQGGAPVVRGDPLGGHAQPGSGDQPAGRRDRPGGRCPHPGKYLRGAPEARGSAGARGVSRVGGLAAPPAAGPRPDGDGPPGARGRGGQAVLPAAAGASRPAPGGVAPRPARRPVDGDDGRFRGGDRGRVHDDPRRPSAVCLSTVTEHTIAAADTTAVTAPDAATNGGQTMSRIMQRMWNFLGFEEDERVGLTREPATPRTPVFSLHTQRTMEIVVIEPAAYDQAQTAADYLKTHRPIVVNL